MTVTLDGPLRRSYPVLRSDGVAANTEIPLSELKFRLDKDELTSGMATVRSNILRLFHVGASEDHRRLIVDLEPPRFGRPSIAEKVTEQKQALNEDQRRALDRVLNGTDIFFLFVGLNV